MLGGGCNNRMEKEVGSGGEIDELECSGGMVGSSVRRVKSGRGSRGRSRWIGVKDKVSKVASGQSGETVWRGFVRKGRIKSFVRRDIMDKGFVKRG